MGKLQKIYASSAGWALVLLQVSVIFLFAQLLPQAEWLADEYTQIGGLEGAPDQFHVFLERLNWSPRPVSEFLLFLYDEVVIFTHHAFAGLFSALLWVTFFLVTCIGATRAPRRHRAARLAVPLLFFVLCALRGQSFEVMFWPAGVAPYLLTLAFMLAFVLDVLDAGPINGPVSRRQSWLLVGMTLCSEVGMVFAALWSAGSIVHGLATTSRWRGRLRVITPFIPAGIACVFVVGLSLTGRMKPDAAARHATSAMPQLWDALCQVARDYLRGPVFSNPRFGHHLASNLIFEAALCVGIAALFASRVLTVRRSRIPLVITMASAIGTQFTITFLSLRKYGTLTDRHQVVCLFLTFLSLFCVAAIMGMTAARRMTGEPKRTSLGYPVLALCVVYLALKFVPVYTATLRDKNTILADRAFTWAQGWNGNNAIVFRCKQDTAFIPDCPTGLPSGVYPINVDTDWQVRGIMWFFHKTTLTLQKH